MYFNPINGCKPSKENKFITVWISDLELTPNWLKLFVVSIFLLVSNISLNDSNKLVWILCLNWKQPSLLLLIKNEPYSLLRTK